MDSTARTKVKRNPFSFLTALSIRRPWLVVAVWVVAIASLGYAGRDIEERLSAGNVIVDGTESQKAAAVTDEKFGHTEQIAVMLKGPRSKIDRFGPKVSRAIDSLEDVTVVSPWTEGSPAALRSKTGEVLLIVHARRSFEKTGEVTYPEVRRVLNKELPASVDARVVGTATYAAEAIKLNNEAVELAEIIAAPVLLLILLLIFRSPIAAAVPLLLGFSVIVAGTGLISLATHVTDIHVYALASASMLGLALGVDYSLIVVSRLREEMASDKSVKEAVAASLATSGRTVAMAGGIVVAGLVIMTTLVPQLSIISATASAALAACLSVLAALTILPAVLVLVGARINKWTIGRRSARPRLAPLVTRLIRRPGIASVALLVPLLTLAVPALGLETGPPDLRFLPPDSRVLGDVEAVGHKFGEGWVGPFEVVVASGKGPLTDRKSLKALDDFQNDLSRDRDVAVVMGPGSMAEPAGDLSKQVKRGEMQLATLSDGLGEAYEGVGRLRDGLAKASTGSRTLSLGTSDLLFGSNALAVGTDEAQAGIEALEQGLYRTEAGSKRLSTAMGRLNSGAAELAKAADSASVGAVSLIGPAQAFRQELDQSKASMSSLQKAPQTAKDALQSAKDALDGASLATKADPQYKSAYTQVSTALAAVTGTNPLTGAKLDQSYNGISAALDRAQKQAQIASGQAKQISAGANKLAVGLDEIKGGNSELQSGTYRGLAGTRRLSGAIEKARRGSGSISGGAGRLRAGAGRLSTGIADLDHGVKALNQGLDDGYRKSSGLETGLKKISIDVSRAKSSLGSDQKIDSDRLSDSGYLTLAAIDAGSDDQRKSANLVVNADRGGDTAKIYVVTDSLDVDLPTFTRGLRDKSSRLGAAVGGDAYVGGSGGIADDFDTATEKKRVPVVIALSIVTFIFLVFVFRSPLLAFKAVVLNLLVVAAAFGAIALLFQGPDPLLGGAGFMEAENFFIVYAVVFTLSMDYEIFMINRMRECYLRTGSNETAIHEGVEKTAGVVTGAAFIMTAVFLAFSVSGVINIRQLGVALTVAVLIDATVVRLILLPATMRLLGRANWWAPRWLVKSSLS